MALLSQCLQVVYPVFEEFLEDGRVHPCPVKPFVVTRANEVPHMILEPFRVRKAGLDEAWPTVVKDALRAFKHLATPVAGGSARSSTRSEVNSTSWTP